MEQSISKLEAIIKSLINKEDSATRQLENYVNSNINENYYIVINYKCFKDATRPYMTLRNINNGEEIKTRITQSKIYKDNPFGEYSILKVEKKGFTEKFKKKCIGGEWTESDELESILECYEVII